MRLTDRRRRFHFVPFRAISLLQIRHDEPRNRAAGMKRRILNALLILTSLIGYLEWGTYQRMFLFQGEWEVLGKLISDPVSAAHPFTLLPLIGQILLLITLFQKEPGRLLTFIGLGCLSLLLVFMFLIGLLSLNCKILLSTIPFVVTGILVILEARRRK